MSVKRRGGVTQKKILSKRIAPAKKTVKKKVKNVPFDDDGDEIIPDFFGTKAQEEEEEEKKVVAKEKKKHIIENKMKSNNQKNKSLSRDYYSDSDFDSDSDRSSDVIKLNPKNIKNASSSDSDGSSDVIKLNSRNIKNTSSSDSDSDRSSDVIKLSPKNIKNTSSSDSDSEKDSNNVYNSDSRDIELPSKQNNPKQIQNKHESINSQKIYSKKTKSSSKNNQIESANQTPPQIPQKTVSYIPSQQQEYNFINIFQSIKGYLKILDSDDLEYIENKNSLKCQHSYKYECEILSLLNIAFIESSEYPEFLGDFYCEIPDPKELKQNFFIDLSKSAIIRQSIRWIAQKFAMSLSLNALEFDRKLEFSEFVIQNVRNKSLNIIYNVNNEEYTQELLFDEKIPCKFGKSELVNYEFSWAILYNDDNKEMNPKFHLVLKERGYNVFYDFHDNFVKQICGIRKNERILMIAYRKNIRAC